MKFEFPYGIISVDSIKQYMSQSALNSLYAACADAKSIICAVFPYFCGASDGNISMYARGRDYHLVVREYLSVARDTLLRQFPNETAAIFCDASPLPERIAAASAGLGVLGDNGLLITPRYGSYIFIGELVTSAPLPCQSVSAPLPGCLHCGACARGCPGGALDDGFHAERCVSAITQKKGELSDAESEIVLKSGMLWGCDACQLACPMNSHAELTPISAFRENLICTLNPSDIAGLSRRAFKQKYPERAFTWRGVPATIDRVPVPAPVPMPALATTDRLPLGRDANA